MKYVAERRPQSAEANEISLWPDEIRRIRIWHVAGYGAGLGALAGIVTLCAAVLLQLYSGDDPWLPLRYAASVPLHTPPEFVSVPAALSAGTVFHIILASLLGILGLFTAELTTFKRSAMRSFGLGPVLGTAAWVVNFYVAAPVLGAGWFATGSFRAGFFFHGIVFGGVLGALLVWYLGTKEVQKA